MIRRFGLLLLVLVLNIVFNNASELSRYGNNQWKIHRIRHLRHLIRNFKTPLESSEYIQQCIAKSWEINPQREDCPPKRCSKNHHCWEEYGQSKLCVCDPHLCGLVCLEYDLECPRPKQPSNGEARYSRLRVGDHVEYTCKLGYAVKGPRKRYCQANLRLSERDPVCTNQTDSCFSAPNIPNTQVSDGIIREDYKNRETVNLTCQNGFEDPHKGYLISTCVGNEWRNDPINCQRISCGKLADPENGRTMYHNNYTYQSVAIQFCNDGFKIKCSHIVHDLEKNCKRVCEADKTWSGETAICTPILCPELRAPENGEIVGHWNTVNSIKNFKCNDGYQLSGSHLRKCLHVGVWDGFPATCIVRNCGIPPKIPFAKVNYKATTYGETAEYQCQSGTTLFGKTQFLTCGVIDNNSTWVPKPVPQCLRHCSPFIIKNAKIYIRDTMQSRDMILYQEVAHNTVIIAKCNYGFELNRQDMPICNNGSWNYKPICMEASCSGRPPSMKYSTVRFYSMTHNSVARYYCHTGYRIKQNNNDKITFVTSMDIKCIKGNWTSIPSEGCQPTRCNKPPTPIHGEIYLLGQNDRTRLTDELIKPSHNRVVKYECHPDYRLRGPKITVCLNGQWSPPETPICDFIMHDELPLLWLFYQSPE